MVEACLASMKPCLVLQKQNMTKAEHYLLLMNIVLHILSTITVHSTGGETEAVSKGIQARGGGVLAGQSSQAKLQTPHLCECQPILGW